MAPANLATVEPRFMSARFRPELKALLLIWMPLLLGLPALAAPIDMICSLPPASVGGLGTLVDFSLSEGSGRGLSFWPTSGQRRSVLAQVASWKIQILQPGSGVLLFSIDRLNGSITAAEGEPGRCTNAGHVRLDRAI
ncbi:hypothetical protein KQ302_03500 [Synechococcus sp. CS-602]|nr:MULTISPECIES: hypothetical protein [Synechococcaceae]MCT0202056.1 hypothetical protein [Synechococcus sp. CS-603]MCT4363860.1 hypothetical protein [Candidatus Regnicoccus frigidus MAG-AL1]APD47228.1 hypothetical protein BM449_01505 [Synechococcus sp. SynAce01]MCT0204184.1 hypothetical protein [Synechococcus sp. CS-602]MCT0245617.1 hypothetical protein [Synechococcus sp. CS-601]